MKKDASKEVPWALESVDLDQLPPDYPALVGVIFTVVGFMFKLKIIIFLAVIFLLSSLTRSKFVGFDWLQKFISFGFILSGIVFNYFYELW